MKTIYGGKPRHEDTFHKNEIANIQESGEVNNLFFATGDAHARYRKIITPAFSEATIRQQEPMIISYAKELIDGLRNTSGVGHYPDCNGKVDIVPWFNFIVSDILSHMLFGSGLDCLKNAQSHPWVTAGYNALIESTYIEAAHRLWPYHKICEYLFVPRETSNNFQIHADISRRKLDEREKLSSTGGPWWDFPSFTLGKMSNDEVFDNINVIATAAGETTSSTLSAVLYYITHNPDAYKKLVEEIRGAFAVEEEITTNSSSSLKYLKATIKETFRIHPTIPVGLHRLTPKKGKFVDGNWVPGGVCLHHFHPMLSSVITDSINIMKTWVSVANLAACRTSAHWKHPDRFIPERWLCEEEFESDIREASSPYSIGVRNCIGMR